MERSLPTIRSLTVLFTKILPANVGAETQFPFISIDPAAIPAFRLLIPFAGADKKPDTCKVPLLLSTAPLVTESEPTWKVSPVPINGCAAGGLLMITLLVAEFGTTASLQLPALFQLLLMAPVHTFALKASSAPISVKKGEMVILLSPSKSSVILIDNPVFRPSEAKAQFAAVDRCKKLTSLPVVLMNAGNSLIEALSFGVTLVLYATIV